MVIIEAFLLGIILWTFADNLNKKYQGEKASFWSCFALIVALVLSLSGVVATFCGIYLLAKDVIGAFL